MAGPSRSVWASWALALCGGLIVLVAAALLLLDDCARGGRCSAARVQVATTLTVTGTALAVIGGCTATILAVRQFRRALPPRA